MPICFMPGRFPRKKDEAESLAGSMKIVPPVVPAHPEWREPPGYLGEAVRRAKRIASLSQLDNPSKPAS